MRIKMHVVLLLGLVMLSVIDTHADEIVIGQKNKAFVLGDSKIEHISIKAGDTVRFLNEDPFYHNIFSVSKLRTFDLGAFGQGESRDVIFDKSGTVDVECAIHPDMYLVIDIK